MNIFNRYKEIGSIPQFDLDQHQGDELFENESVKVCLNVLPFIVLCVILILTMGLKLLNLQITNGSSNLVAAEGNSLRKRIIPAPRGLIVDATGKPLLENAASFNLAIYPGELPRSKSDRLKIYEKLITDLGINRDQVIAIEDKKLLSLDPIIIGENLTQEALIKARVEITDMPGVEVIERPTRHYSSQLSLSHLIGYIGKIGEAEYADLKSQGYRLDSMIGKTGIEAEYETKLKGKDGYEIVEVDSKGRLQQRKPGEEPQIGQTLQLTINLDLQKRVEEIVNSYVSEKKNNKVVAIVSKAKTGEIEAMVSTPTFDANSFLGGISAGDYKALTENKDLPLLDRAIAGRFPSGSSIKPVIAAAGLQDGTITETTRIDTPPVIEIGQWKFPDWKAHGYADVKKALAESNNIFFYAVGGGYDKIKGLGAVKLDTYLRNFGFDEKTGIDLPSEQAGFIPTPEWKQEQYKENWYIGDTYHLAIGQGGFLVTPMQMTRAISSIANNGALVTPHLLKAVDGSDSGLSWPTKSNQIDQKNLRIVRDGMRQTITAGSARALNDLHVAVAGKTGTAQFGTDDKTHAWFVSFAPFDNPEHVVVIFVEGGGEGFDQAAPMAKQIYQYLYP